MFHQAGVNADRQIDIRPNAASDIRQLLYPGLS